MKKTGLLAALAASLCLVACQSSSMLSAVDGPKARVDASLKRRCAGVVDVPERDLGRAEAVRLWSQDRSRLGDCAKRHSALVDAVGVLER